MRTHSPRGLPPFAIYCIWREYYQVNTQEIDVLGRADSTSLILEA